jgi:hypothetical protein
MNGAEIAAAAARQQEMAHQYPEQEPLNDE